MFSEQLFHMCFFDVIGIEMQTEYFFSFYINLMLLRHHCYLGYEPMRNIDLNLSLFQLIFLNMTSEKCRSEYPKCSIFLKN